MGYQLQKSKIISHLLYKNYLKLFAEDNKTLDRELDIVKRFSDDMCLEVYLGIEKGGNVDHKNMKQKIKKEYLSRLRHLLLEAKSSKESTRVIKLKSEPLVKYPSNRVVTSKYTVWNFLPKNLFEQFRRIANFYFLCMAVISLVIESPVSPVTSIAPLLFVIIVSAIKQGYEDFLRHMADREVNNTPVSVIRKGCIQTIPAKNIKVGDLVKVECDQDIPCDLVLLLSSHSESKCFVTTANLDGETNLKTVHCPRSLKRTCRTETDLNSLEATIKCENPTPHLYKFHGRIEFGAKTSTLLRQSELMRQQSVCSAQNSDLQEEIEMGALWSEFNTDYTDKAIIPPDAGKPVGIPPQLRKTSQPKRTESFPKSSHKTHKKTFSNVERVSFNLEKTATPLPKVKEWSYQRKASLLCKRNPSLLQGNRLSFKTPDGNVADPLSAENLLLKGSKLKSTDFIFGCAVYTGPDTKLALNSKLSSCKFSTVEKSINKFLLFYLGILIVKVIVSTVFKVVKETKCGDELRAPYIGNANNDFYEVTFFTVIEAILSFVALYNCVIPISLYVTIELQKFLGTLFFEWDLRMYDEETDETPICNTSNLNEDLGQIDYLFTDKTGTLTKNEMQFDRCSVNGNIYEERNGCLYPVLSDKKPDLDSPVDLKNCSREMELFLLALALCHTVQVSGGGEKYSATSPDEKALIEAMKKLDIVFQDDDDEMIVIRILGQCKFFKKLDVLEFSSERKRMSVIIQDEEENITLYCKGAETSVIPQVMDGPKDLTLKHVAEFATQRLRTLVVGYKFLTKQEYAVISERLKIARQTLSSEREGIVAETYRKIESAITVLGATGIKDDIQDEVKETLRSLKAAGIKIWMLTGDKLETAENISLECGHFEEGFVRLILIQQKNPDSCREILQQYLEKLEENEDKDFGLIVDGESLSTALTYTKDLFRTVCVKCAAVICSRMSPLQKKEVVKLIKEQKSCPVTAAIGDGANDVSMIQEAHVGIGIMGKEGRQAVRCSDFAFSKFKFLRRALLIHGHWYYLRVATLVQYFFYKNLAFVLPQFYFLFFSGYSIQSLYDSLYVTGYNTVFTALPILIYGLIEQDYPASKLESYPELYLDYRRNGLMSWANFFEWFVLGVWHSVVVFFFPMFFFMINSSVLSGGKDVYLEAFGTVIFHSGVTIVTLKLLIHSKFWTGIFVGSIFASIIVLVLSSIVYSCIYVDNLTSSNFWVYITLLGSPTFWLLIILICAASLIPDFVIYAFKDRKKRKHPRSSQI